MLLAAFFFFLLYVDIGGGALSGSTGFSGLKGRTITSYISMSRTIYYKWLFVIQVGCLLHKWPLVIQVAVCYTSWLFVTQVAVCYTSGCLLYK